MASEDRRAILGLNAYHGDSSACILLGGRLVAAVEEERFRRIKHWAGLPVESIRYCLREAGLSIGQVGHIAVNRDPRAHFLEKALYAIFQKPDLGLIQARFRNRHRIGRMRQEIARALGVSLGQIGGRWHAVEHHRAHLASAFLVSSFKDAALVSVDGFGDFVSMMWGVGEGGRIRIRDQVKFPHSLGLFYLAVTQFLGFPKYGDEYKVMGLSAYGKPTEIEKMRRIVRLKPGGRFELDLDFFVHHSSGVSMTWDGGEPVLGGVYSRKMAELLGKPRAPSEPIDSRHENLAASLQRMYEEAFFHILRHVHERTGNPRLCLAGGCAMNSVANGKISSQTPFRDVYIQAAAGDAGGAIGAAYYVWNHLLGGPRSFVMSHAYWGPGFSADEIRSAIREKEPELRDHDCVWESIESEEALCEKTARLIAEGKVIGWFQGKMEWGPRALGNRSILCDPRRPDMKDILNQRIKHRETFRPFAPSLLREKTADWFETDAEVPFMLQVFQVRSDKRKLIPAVTHVDGSGRLQTVTRDQNPLYYRLISSFENLTGVPILLNTSFNENEPIVCRPSEALECFLKTSMDALVLGTFLLSRGKPV